jgi:hypothetical protein
MTTHEVEPLKVLGIPLDLERLTYTTVVLISVLVVYDHWGDLASFPGTAAVIIAPALAVSMAHGFAEALHEMKLFNRPLDGAEWRHLLRGTATDLLATVPPLLLVAVGWVGPLDPGETIVALLWGGTLTLVVLAALAAYRAGLRGWRLIGASAVGGVIGLIVISMQILLKPH